MSVRSSFDYTIIRVVPHVERQEFVNAGIVLFCKQNDYLDTRIDFELNRVKSLSPNADLQLIRKQLSAFEAICAGRPEAGYMGKLSKSERFRWLAAPGSTVIQTSEVHSGKCEDPPSLALHRLFDLLVKYPPEI